MPEIDFNSLVAPKATGPRPGQSPAPHDAWSGGYPVGMSADLRRVLALPRRALELDGTERAEAIIDQFTELCARPLRNGRCGCAAVDPVRHKEEGCITRLRLVQALALREIAIAGGLVGPIGVGHGKTLLDVLAAFALRRFDPKVRKIVLLIPPRLQSQLQSDYRYIGQHFRVPQIVFHGIDYKNTLTCMDDMVPLERDAPEVHVVTYARLSRPESTAWLEDHLRPDAFISDEVHKIRNPKSAGGSRIDRWMRDHPNTRFVCWSGSITKDKISDYGRFARWALRGGSPLPLDEEVEADWGRALNPSNNPADPGPLLALCAPGEHINSAWRRRVIETLGVVTTSAPSSDSQLELYECEAPVIPQDVQHALKMIRGQLPGQDGPQRPDGEELVDALSQRRTAIEAACGFYYRWIFPRCEFPRDTDLVDEWREKRRNWFREVRKKLEQLEDHLDSPHLVENAAKRFYGDMPRRKGLPEWESRYWPAWRDIRNKVYHETEEVWISDYLVDDVARRALERPMIVWYEHSAFAERLAAKSRLPMFGGGEKAKLALIGDPQRGIPGEDGSRSVIASIKALGTGTNRLQFRFHEAIIPVPAATPDTWEQCLGRLDRPGQASPVVRYGFYRHTPEFRKSVDTALMKAYYVEGIHGAQKIVQGFALGGIDTDPEA